MPRILRNAACGTLNRAKVKRQRSSVKFIGHLTSQGLMPILIRFRPFCRCLNLKLLQHWSDCCGWWRILQSLCSTFYRWQPPRRLEDKSANFQLLERHSLAMNTITNFLTGEPFLRHYGVNMPVTVQCYANQSGLEAVCLQKGQPVCCLQRPHRYRVSICPDRKEILTIT